MSSRVSQKPVNSFLPSIGISAVPTPPSAPLSTEAAPKAGDARTTTQESSYTAAKPAPGSFPPSAALTTRAPTRTLTRSRRNGIGEGSVRTALQSFTGGGGSATAAKPGAAGASSKASRAQDDNNQNHVENSIGYLQTETRAGGMRKNAAFDALADVRDPGNPQVFEADPEAQSSGARSAVDGPGSFGRKVPVSDKADLELAAGFTPKEFNGVAYHLLLTDPLSASALVGRAASNPRLMDRMLREGTKETKTAFAHAVLSDSGLSPQQKLQMLRTLTAPPRTGKDPEAVTLDQVLGHASDRSLHGLNELMAGPGGWGLAEAVAKNTSSETRSRVASGVLQDNAIAPDQRTDALRGLMQNTGKQGLNDLMDRATPDERGAYSAVIAGSVRLQERVGRDLDPQNQQRVVDEMLKLPLPRSATGRNLALLIHPANMSPQDKNKLIDHLLASGRLPAFLETQQDHGYTAESLLPGLRPGNAAAIQRGFQRLAEEARADPRVADPNQLGRQVQASEAKSYQEAIARTQGSSTTDTTTSTYTVCANVSAKGKVGVPLVAEGEVGVEGSYSYAHASSTAAQSSTSDTASLAKGYSATFGSAQNLESRQTYDRDVKRWQNGAAYTRLADQVQGWATEDALGAESVRLFLEARGRLER
jgi:hypothetical protein